MNHERVLLVDDDPDLLAVMGAHLTRQGYAVDAFTDGSLALNEVAAGEPFAVLVTDLDMPTLHGLDLLRAARIRDPRLEVIVITGNGTLDAAVKAMRHDGAYDFLIKPFETLNVLSLAVARATAHRQLLLERAALTERLNALLIHTGDAILSADADGALLVVNPAAARLLGRDDLVGRAAAASLPKPLASLLANWQALGQGQPLTVELAGPAQAQWMVSLAPIPGQGWVMIIRDITLLKRLDDVKFQLLSDAAARLQLPLAQAISNMAELNALVGDKDPRASDILFRQTGVWDRIQRWMDDLLEVVRVESGVGLRPVDIDLAAVLPDLVRSVPERAIREKHVNVALDLAAGAPRLRIDPDLLRQLVHGLVRWAAQRSAPGGTVRLALTAQGGQVGFEIADTGPALAETDLARLFEKSLGGADRPGLELALVKSIADRMGGQVWARRQANGGVIGVYLPVTEASGEAEYV